VGIVLTHFFGIRGISSFVYYAHISRNIHTCHTTLSSLRVYTKGHYYTRYNESSLYHVDM